MRGLAVLLLLSGCRQLLGFENLATGDAAEPPPPDGPCETLSSECVGDVLRSCTQSGSPPTDTTCAWGCIETGEPHCGQLDPTGGVLTSADLVDAPGLQDLSLGSPLGQIVNTTTGEIPGLRPPGTGLEAGIEFSVRDNVGVFRVHGLQLVGTVAFIGTNAVAVVSTGDIAIDGIVDLKGGCAGTTPGPGGGAGGNGTDGLGMGGAREGANGSNGNGGGGGGGHGAAGSNGGVGVGAALGVGGPGYGDDEISMLVGGSGGGGGGGTPGSRGGGGGGAIQLVSGTTIAIAPGAGIDAGGCGGEKPGAGDDLGGGGGGGSGGTIVLEAPVIRLDGGLAANGGAGGGGTSTSTDGQDGQFGVMAAVGGNNTGQGGRGGNGGVGGDRSGDPGAGDNAGGGGGGAVGRIRLLTRAGTVTLGAMAFTSPGLTDPSTTTTQAAAVVQ